MGNFSYIKCTTDGNGSGRLEMYWVANQVFLADDATDGVLSFKVPAGKGTLTINAKTAAKARCGGVFVGKDLQTDTIRGTAQADFVYNIDVANPTSIYITGIKSLAPKKGMYIYKISWVPGDATGIREVETVSAKEDDNYYTLTGMKVANPRKGIYIRNGKKVVVK